MTKKKELDANTQEIQIRLAAKECRRDDYWPLATVIGGIDKMTIKHEGNKTIIEIVSPEAKVYAEDYKRPLTGKGSRQATSSKPSPA